MFCKHCYKEIFGHNRYCGSCGKENIERSYIALKKPVCFNEFMNKKKHNIKSLQRTKSLKSKEATIFGSILKDNMKQERGSRLPVNVNVSWGASEVRKAVYDKMCRYNKHIGDWSELDYNLVYKSGEKILFIPGTKIPFTVEKYKEDLGLPYQNINVYLQLYDYTNDELKLPSASPEKDVSEKDITNR